MTRTITQQWNFDQSQDLLWDYLTKPELLSLWLMETDFKLEVGEEFSFDTKPKVKLNFDGNIYCKILKIEPKTQFAYSWKGGPGDGTISLDSIVTWTLTPKGAGCELLLEHSGFKGIKNIISYLIMGKGWQKIVQERLIFALKQPQNA